MKFGVERMESYGKVMDSTEEYNYKLIDMGQWMPGYGTAAYLFMDNPSVPGLRHAEGVPPDIKTVSEAIKWRNGSEEIPIRIT